MDTAVAIATVSISFTAVVVLPLVILLFRIAVKWTKTEDKLDIIAEDLKEIVADKNRVHQEITQQMTDDRKATDRRLRWLEEHIWKTGHGNSSP
jgi:methionine salvage enolase-phosphatase E1